MGGTHPTFANDLCSFSSSPIISKFSKCAFGCISIDYLGHKISGQGVQVDPGKIQAIQHWPLPRTLRNLWGFLGLSGYYRRFVKNYATISAPLTDLLRKDAFIWTDSATNAFHELKLALTSTPVLQLPDFTRPFELQTDASATGIGAVLLQDNHPIAYFSKRLTPRLRSSSAYTREMYAITESVRWWRQYLLGRRFIVYTDHQSLRSLLHQTVQTPDQHKWLTKLLGFEFDIIYKPSIQNRPADALSRLHDEPPPTCLSLLASHLVPGLWIALRQFYKDDAPSASLLTNVQQQPEAHPDYTSRDGVLLYKGKIFIPKGSALQPLIVAEFHNTPTGGHAGITRTYRRLSTTFYWPDMQHSVRDFINRCTTCQTIKSFNHAPQGLLQPLAIPGHIWESASLDFITHLPPSAGMSVILVVVDRLSKQAHFSALPAQFTALKVAEIFVRDVVRLHGLPASLISDRDPLFLSQFWQELFRLQGTHLSMSSAYHPQSDGQTEIVNRYLEDYLRCFTSDNPRHWVQFLSWAEFHYNTAWHSSTKMSPFEVVFGRAPPTILDYTAGTASSPAVDDLLINRTSVLHTLKDNLARAQNRMRNKANSKRLGVFKIAALSASFPSPAIHTQTIQTFLRTLQDT